MLVFFPQLFVKPAQTTTLKTKLRSWHPVPPLHGKIDGEKVEAIRDFLFLAPKSLWTVNAAMKLKGTCSFEGKLGQALHSMLKSRDNTLPTKIHIVKAMVFPVVMYRCENWTIKKAEH